MDSSTHKKVVVRQRQAGLVSGYLGTAALSAATEIEVLTPEGQALRLGTDQVAAIYFVADWSASAGLLTSPPRRTANRLPGVWIRIHSRGRQTIEGLLASDLLEISQGLWLSPLREDSEWQRAYVPRAAMEQVQIVEVVHSPRRRRQTEARHQIGLFGPEGEPAA